MGFSRKEAVRFATAVYAQEVKVEEFVEYHIDVTKAEATVKADLEMITSQICGSVGEDTFNVTLQQKLMATLSLCVIHTHIDDGEMEEEVVSSSSPNKQTITMPMHEAGIMSIHASQRATCSTIVTVDVPGSNAIPIIVSDIE